ncbi:MAG: tRNA pseudouridine(55) synthase TruB [Clostridia bacterium]|jgi:tRNA pseudouridine55 synthase|nr:tRNA pseudouridine(55) synthase TruB [Clostridia bacterium]MBT7123360.1 tRNA pseudouridine(55) synthase TruB [Clostridia bacterium]
MNGIINFLKPPGMSSNGAVVFLRGLLGCKTGHAGTLDPGACGVLPICVGKATRISSYMMGHEKEYIAELTFGIKTDTGDSYGEVTETCDIIPKQIESVLSEFIGNVTQQTPAYSAVKHNGRKLYELARKGIEVAPKLRQVEILDIEYLNQTSDNSHLLRIVCGKGTYIRTLCEDIAKRLDTVAYMSFLARSKCAGLNINDSVTADEIKAIENRNEILHPMEHFLKDLPSVTADQQHRTALFHGGRVPFEGANSQTLVIYAGDELMGLGSITDEQLKISTRLVDE